jgi:hypothetical protein
MHALTLRPIAVACAAALVAGCSSSGGALFPTGAPTTITDITEREATRIFSVGPACPAAVAADPSLAPPAPPGPPGAAAAPAIPAALIAPIAGFLANAAITAITDALREAQEKLTTSYLASGTGDVGQNDCWVIIRGRFGSGGQADARRQGRLPEDTLRKFGLVAWPDFYLEVSLKPDPATVGRGREVRGRGGAGSGAVRLTMRPEFFQFGDTAAENRGNGRKHIVLTLGARLEPVTPPSSAPDVAGGAAAAVVFDLGEVRVGSAIAPVPGAPPPFAEQQRVVTLTAAGNAAPRLNLTGFITETGERSRALALIASAFDSQKASFETVLANFLKNALGEKPRP